MRYLLIFDVRGNGAGRRRVNRYLERAARMIQHSVWEFEDFSSLARAARLVKSAGGKAIAFMGSDRLLLNTSELRRHLRCLK